MAFPSSISTDSLPLAAGRTSPPQPRTILPDLRWPDDLQLHPYQPIPTLPATLPSSLFGWLARERYSGRHALRPRLRTRSGRLLPAPRCRGCPVSGMEALSRSEARVLAWRYVGSHARTRHSTARPLLPGGSGSHSEAAGQSADQIYAATVGSE